MTWLLSLLKWRNAAALLLGWALWGEYRCYQHEARIAADQLQAATDAAARSEAARETERITARNNQRIADELLTAQRERDAAARMSAQRLRELAEARRDNAATEAALATCRSYEGPAVRVLSDATREALVELARDADEVADQLRACQSYVLQVVQPNAPPTPETP